jgi:hypothetical protein
VSTPRADAGDMSSRRWLLLLVVLPAASATIWWVGAILVAEHHARGGGAAAYLLLALAAAVPAAVGMWWSLIADAPMSQRVWAFVGVGGLTALAVLAGALIIVALAAAHCPPNASDCPL